MPTIWEFPLRLSVAPVAKLSDWAFAVTPPWAPCHSVFFPPLSVTVPPRIVK